jgi:hypothetical protein
VVRSGSESALWNELVQRYHYLEYRVPVGANLRYLVRSGSSKHVLACLLWSSPAWKMAARDSWISWTMMVNGCTSQKADHYLRDFFTHVMHSAAFLNIMEHF